MRVTFRLVPKRYIDPVARTQLVDFHPGYDPSSDGTATTPTVIPDPDKDIAGFNRRFGKPDLYDVQILEVNTL